MNTPKQVGYVTQIFLKLQLDEDRNAHRRVLAVLAFLRR